MRVKAIVTILACCLLGGLALGTSDAGAYRKLLSHPVELGNREEWLLTEKEEKVVPVELEGACGLAVSTAKEIYVSDYYHRAIGIYSATKATGLGSIPLPGGRPPQEINTLNAVCGLAIDPAGNLYANEYHQAVLRLAPSEQVIDPGQATGVAVDEKGNVYVDRRTYIAVYAAPIEAGEAPVEKIGGASLLDGYGLAVDPKGGTVYVADAGDGAVKGYPTGSSAATPSLATDYEFASLVDASLAVDPTNGHVLVVDDLKQGFEDPLAAILEFDATGAFLDHLTPRRVGFKGQMEGPIFGEPSGIAVDPKTGDLYVTTGNSFAANAVKYGPFEPFAPSAVEGGEALAGNAAAAPPGSVPGTSPGAAAPTASASVAEQRRGVRVSFDGKLTPHALPRHGMAPVGIVVDAKIGATGGEEPPQLRRITIAINRNGHFASTGLPACRIDQIQPSTTTTALSACRGALVGEGYFSANVKLPEQSPFPSEGEVLAFNGRIGGKPAILAHIYGTQPAPTSAVLPFLLRDGHGTYGTVLEASLPQATGSWGYVTGLRMNLHRRFSYHGRSRSFLSAGCPAPAGFPSAAFPLARTSFDFASGLTLSPVLTRTCRARG